MRSHPSHSGAGIGVQVLMFRLDDEMKQFVLEQRLGYHATVSADGTPNLSHKGTTSVYDARHLFFADIRSPQTTANLRLNPAIDVNVVDVFARRGYRFRGTATIHEDDEVYKRGLELLRERGYQAYESRVRAIVLIRVERAEPITSPAYDVGQTEAELVDHYIDYYVGLHRKREAQ
jgi:hypothetical protein